MMRTVPLDGALLSFDRDTGIGVLSDGPETAHLTQRAPRVVQFGINALSSLYDHPEPSRQGPPVLSGGFWPGQLRLVHAPADIAAAVRKVSELAAAHGLVTRFALFESPLRDADPIGAYRSRSNLFGGHQVILWRPSASVADTVRVVRSVTGLELSEATELVQRAPIEVLLRVSQYDAKTARDALRAIGADAEMLGPQHFTAK